MNIRFFEIVFPDGYSMIIKATREPSVEEAEQFIAPDMKNLHYNIILSIEEWEESDARTAFDFDGESLWPVFGNYEDAGA